MSTSAAVHGASSTPPTRGGGGEAIVFSTFRIDQRAGELTRSGAPIPLRPKTWAVLLYLARRPGALVSRDELLDAIWPDVAVTPDTLTKSIGELRLALGDAAAPTPRFIATVHGRGFRFIPDTGSAPAAEHPVPASLDSDAAVQPFVGRAAELLQLESCFGRATAAERQLVFITGSPGVGKTTLVETLLDQPAFHRATPPVWIARAACVEQHGSREPYMPVLEALGRLARRADAGGLAPLLRRTAPTWLAQMPWLLGDDAATLHHSLATPAERMLREFAAFIEALTADVTLVLLLEDLHWCDPSTVDLLALLAEHREPARLLVIGTYRPAELAVREHVLARAVRTMLVRRQALELPVYEFDQEDVQRYLEARFPGAPVPLSLAERVCRHTDGNPLFVGSVVADMMSRGLIIETDLGWSFAAGLERIDLGMPDDIRRMIASQFDALAPADRDLLSAASVAGVEFTTKVIGGALRCDLDDVETRCERLARTKRFLSFAGSDEWPDGTPALRYRFSHEIYRQALYDCVSPGHRQRLHQRVGEALEACYPDRAIELSSELADHFERSLDYTRAVRYLALSAARAQQRFAGREAIDELEAAIALVGHLSGAARRQRTELDLRMHLAALLVDHRGFASDAVQLNCERAYELCEAIGTPARRFEVLYALCHVHAARADAALLGPALADLHVLAEQVGTSETRMLCDIAALRVAAHAGRFSEAHTLAQGRLAALSAEGLTGDPTRYGADPIIAAAGHHAFALWFLGDLTQARAVTQANLMATASPRVSKFTRAMAQALAAIIAMLDRDVVQVRQITETLLTLTAEQSFPFWDAIGLALHGWARVQDGELDDGIAELDRARTELAATGARIFSTYSLAFLAEARLQRGDRVAGLADVDEGLRIAETTLDRSYWAELWRIKGELLLPAISGARRRGGRSHGGRDWPGAERCFLQALEVARTSQAASLELRAAISLARAWAARARGAEAQRLLEPLCRSFPADVSSPDLADARALLARLTTP